MPEMTVLLKAVLLNCNVGLICLKFCLWPILIEGTEYEYSGSEDEEDAINEDEGEPRYVIIHLFWK